MAEAGTPAKFVMSSRGGDPESAHVTTSKDVLVLAASAPAPTIAKVVDMSHYESATDWFGKDSVAGRLHGANLGALPGVTLLVEGQAADDPSHAWSRMGASIEGLTSEYAEFALDDSAARLGFAKLRFTWTSGTGVATREVTVREGA